MTYELFQRVTLREDVPEHGLCAGDVATVVEHFPRRDAEDGYAIEVFNALGDTIAVIVLPASSLEPLKAHEVLHVRSLAAN